jgi:hypothetical protein
MIKTIKKLARVENPECKTGESDVIAFQVVDIDYDVFGKSMADRFDTAIKDDGQFIINGNGFFKDGFKLPAEIIINNAAA